MKQSKKLLSIFLAMIMLLGTVSVIGNAALAKNQVAYDSIDNAKLTPEQVAGIILDMLDNDILAGMDTVDLSILGEIRLNSVDHIFEDVCSLRGSFWWTIGSWLLGDLQNFSFNALKDSDWDDPWQRSDTNLKMLYQVVQLLGDNASIVSKAAYGIGTDNGISLGLVGNFLSLGDIENILADLPTFLTEMVYDMLIYGSNKDGKQTSYEDIETLGSLPTEVNTLDKMVNVAVKNLLTKPQKYDWVPTGEYTTDEEGNQVPVTKKVWDEESYILTASKLEGKNLDLSQNSFFSLLDTVLPVAYETFGTVVLNHDVKKLFMEAMGVDFVRITDEAEIARIKTTSATNAINKYIDVEDANADTSSVKNYFCNAQMWKVGDTWYFRDYVTTEIGTDATTGEPITEKQHRFFKAQTYSVDDLYEVFNWDYYLTAESLNFTEMLKAADGNDSYGSLVGSLNHIIHVIFENALSADFLASKGTSVDALWADGDNSNFNENLMNTAKFLLINYTFMFFGRNEAYVDLETFEAKPEFVAKINSFDSTKDSDREGLIAYMLLPMLGDVLPQLVYSMDMFEDGLQIEQVAALLVREFLTDLTPQVNDYVCNYDALIFSDPSLKTGRTLVKGQSSDYWMNLVLNMGLDLAAVYLDNIANFAVDLTSLAKLHEFATAKSVQPWQVVLEEIVDWAILYIGDGSNSVIKGLDPNTLEVSRSVSYTASNDSHSYTNNYDGKAFWRISTALNTLLPLGIVNGCSSNSFGLDVEVLFNKIRNDIIPTLNIEGIIGLFGRNNHTSNFLNEKNLYKEILDLVNQLLGCLIVNDKGEKILQVGTDASTILANVISQASLQLTINSLLTGLNSRKEGLLIGALPVLAAFISDWGGEQEIASPDLSIGNTTRADAGTLNVTLTLRNGSKGVWRSYMDGTTRKQDDQYTYDVKSITSLQGLGISGGTGALDYGTTANVKLSKSGVPTTGLSDRIDITYTVSDENGNLMANGAEFTKSYFTYVSYDDNALVHKVSDKSSGNEYKVEMRQYLYYSDANISNIASDQCLSASNKRTLYTMDISLTPSGTTTQNGITLGSVKETIAKNGGAGSFAPFTVNPSSFQKVDKNGTSYEFTYKLSNGKSESTCKTVVFVYNQESYDLLDDLVNDEVGKARIQADYKDDALYMDYLGKLASGMQIIYNPRVDGNFWTDCYARYEALLAAVEALEAVEKTDAEKAAAGGSIDGLVDNLKTQLNTIEENFNGKDYRTYMLYRWERYKDARSDARWIIDLKEEVKFGAPTKHYPYGSYSQAQYTNLVTGDKYDDFLLGLLVDMTEEEKADAAERYKNRSNEYYRETTLDVAQYSNLLTRQSQRLITRTSTPVTSYLQKEIDSAVNTIGENNNAGYSQRSWDAYSTALENAKTALSSASQDTIFNAKYQLQVARNNLRTTAQEADYSELEILIPQAENALNTQAANDTIYKNADEDFGKLLMALGYTTEGGTKLFGGARDVFNTSYDKHDQDEIDDAADDLKAALAKLEYNSFSSNKPSTVGTTQVETGEKDENDNPIKESIYTTTIDPKQVSSVVAAAVKGNNDWTVQVSLDEKYSAQDGKLDKLPVGTGATVTVFKTEGSVTVPVATIKVIVKGDVTGDGVINALDCMIVDLVANNNSDLGGVYLEAGDVVSNADAQRITLADLNEVANKAVA